KMRASVTYRATRRVARMLAPATRPIGPARCGISPKSLVSAIAEHLPSRETLKLWTFPTGWESSATEPSDAKASDPAATQAQVHATTTRPSAGRRRDPRHLCRRAQARDARVDRQPLARRATKLAAS